MSPPWGLLCLGLTLDWPWTLSYPLHLCNVMLGLSVPRLGDCGPPWHSLVVLLSLSGCLRHLGESSSVRLYVLPEYWWRLLMCDVFSFETWVDRPFTLGWSRLPDGLGSHPLPGCSALLFQVGLWPCVLLEASAFVLDLHTDLCILLQCWESCYYYIHRVMLDNISFSF